MADVLISDTMDIDGGPRAHDALVWINPTTAYVFYPNLAGENLVYRKTTDGGATWGAEVTVATSAVVINRFSVWYDRWTPGDSGSLIHIAWIRNNADGTFYRSLDTSTDVQSFPADVAIYDNVNFGGGYTIGCMAITKARGGNLYIAYTNGPVGFQEGFFRSTNGGLNWGSRALVTEGVDDDKYFLLPSNEADDQDIWCFYWDKTATELSIKTYDDSGNAWAEQVIAAAMDPSAAGYLQMSGSIRHSDNHAIVCAMDDWGVDVGSLLVWDINGAGSITPKANIYTAELLHQSCSLTIDQNTDNIYIAYVGDPGDGSTDTLNLRYKISTNGGNSWGAPVLYNEGGGQFIRENWTARSVDTIGGGRWLIAWWDNPGIPPNPINLETNAFNAIDILPSFDVVISDTIGAATSGAAHDALVWTDTLTGYMFYLSGVQDLVYRKTTDGGATWGAEVTVATSAVVINKFSVWYDRWTPGDTGNLIHIAWIRNNADGTFYRSLDTSTDVQIAPVDVSIIANTNTSHAYQLGCISITKARGGNLYIADENDVGFPATQAFSRSVDGGASWVARALLAPAQEGNRFFLLPSNEVDDQDIWAFYYRSDLGHLLLRTYDDSGNAWTEQLISAVADPTASFALQMSGSIRHSDGHAIVCAMTAWGLNPATLLVWDINGAPSIAPMANVYTDEGALGEISHLACALTIDQNNQDIYISFDVGSGGVFFDDLNLWYTISTNGGNSWGAAVPYSQDGPQTIRENWTDRNIGIDDGGRWLIAWFEDAVVSDEVKTNFANSFVPELAPPEPEPVYPPGGGFTRALSGGAPGFISYISPDGREYPLHTPHQFGRWVVSFSGFGTPPIDYITQRGPFQHGVTVKDFFLRPRVIQLLIRQAFCDRVAWWAGRAALLNEIRPNRQATATGATPGTLRIVETDGTTRDLSVFITEGPRFEPRVSGEWDEWAFMEALRFIAHDPVAFDPDEVTAAFMITLDDDLVFSITFPIRFGAGDLDDTLAVTYPGTWLTFPIITIVGPVETPRIDNNTTGEKIEFSIDIGPGRTITIDLSEGAKTVVDDLGSNLIGGITSDSDLGTFHIAPDPEAPGGVNDLRLRGIHPTGSTSVSLAYFSRYFGF